MAWYHMAGEDEQMTLTPYMVFVENNTQSLSKNVTFSPAEWMQLVSDIHQAQSNAMTAGLIIGFVVGVITLSLGLWWKNTGNIWWRNRGIS